MKSVKIKNKILEVPIIQGGMGVGVSLSNLASSVMKNGCMGVISAAQPGFLNADFLSNNDVVNYNSLINEIKKAKKDNEDKLLGVNIMVAMRDYDNMVKAAIEGGADVIISGAGIPLQLPALTKGHDIALAPIVSSGKVAKMICKKWDRSYECIPDLIIIEGPLAGGHLGFKEEQISNIELKDILKDVLIEIEPYEEKYQKKIPIFVAGGIFDGKDIADAINLGASGVQIGTRFIATFEADCHDNFKQAIVNSKEDDIVIIKSPVGMPGRALATPLIKRLQLDSNIPITNCYNCLTPCNPAQTPYCISDALIASAKGDLENGLFFCGSLAYKINEIVYVKDLIAELVNQANEILD
ncbi:nitronate monooxygenase [Bacilli bacterium PM5-3]|nr:nitronate monooxygenase [Bacilli bacterium PM5-3]MDH6604104.1 nitronate monooxygenase [Bacilli bacterium PM5-9]